MTPTIPPSTHRATEHTPSPTSHPNETEGSTPVTEQFSLAESWDLWSQNMFSKHLIFTFCTSSVRNRTGNIICRTPCKMAVGSPLFEKSGKGAVEGLKYKLLPFLCGLTFSFSWWFWSSIYCHEIFKWLAWALPFSFRLYKASFECKYKSS